MTARDTDNVKEFASPAGRGPVLLRPPGPALDPFAWLRDARTHIEEILRRDGGVVLRGFGFRSVSDFNKVAQIICPELLDYVNRSTPRTRLGGKIYTATEYPADRSIPLHNENSYSDAWPRKIMFYSAVVAPSGGETPVADSRRVYQKIDPAVRARFERAGVCYIRNYTAGVDLSWQEVFQTSSRQEVEHYCEEHGMELTWGDGRPELTTRHVRQATLTHPETEEPVWFNQAHLFHVSALRVKEQRALVDELGSDNLPRNARYGDGEDIELDVLEHIREVYDEEKIEFSWRQGDIMILDNILFAHARNPFEGVRKVVVAMG
jgi:alpha-ketoglutarate-dependent taurine dioxygenase